MNILILSHEGNGVPLGYRLALEKHNVTMWIKDPNYCKVGDGFVNKTDNWIPLKKNSQLIIFDDSEMGEASETLRKEGFNVWGGNKWSDEIEMDRKKGQDFFKSIGMKTSPSKTFKTIDEGIAFVQKNPKRYVVKPDGHISTEKSLTYVGRKEDGSDLISTLQNYKTKWASQIESYELQEVKNGVEMAIGGLFNGKDFLEPILVNFEHKRLFPGDIGPSTGEMGTTGVYIGKNKIYKETLGRCIPKLREQGYVGYFDINNIIEKDVVWPLEVTSRFGYPTLNLFLCSISENLGDLMYRISRGEGKAYRINKPYTACVVVASPPFPFSADELHRKYSEGQEITFEGKDRSNYWPNECLKDKDKWVVSGHNGYNLVVTGSGRSVKEACGKSYANVRGVTLANSFYRNDIGIKTESNLRTLHEWGWLKL